MQSRSRRSSESDESASKPTIKFSNQRSKFYELHVTVNCLVFVLYSCLIKLVVLYIKTRYISRGKVVPLKSGLDVFKMASCT